jgi:hypothetical protein
MFQRNMPPPSSGLKNKLSRKRAHYLLDASFLHGLSFNSKDGGNSNFQRNNPKETKKENQHINTYAAISNISLILSLHKQI